MLRELLAKVQSVEFEESESCLYLGSLTWSGASRVTLALRLYCDDEPPEAWNVSCDCVVAHLFRNQKFSSVSLTFDHPVLWPHNSPQQELYFSSKPSEPAAVFGSLVQAFHDLVGPWFPISRFMNPMPVIQLLSGGHGLLASGPEPIIDRLAHVLDSYGVRHNVLPLRYGRIAYNTDVPVRALVFDDCYVAAHKIEARRCETKA